MNNLGINTWCKQRGLEYAMIYCRKAGKSGLATLIFDSSPRSTALHALFILFTQEKILLEFLGSEVIYGSKTRSVCKSLSLSEFWLMKMTCILLKKSLYEFFSFNRVYMILTRAKIHKKQSNFSKYRKK